MRPTPQTDGQDHAGLQAVTAHQHHRAPVMVSITNTTQSLPPGTTFNLDVALGTAEYKHARVQLLGARQMAPGQWRECAELVVSRTASEAVGHSHRDVSMKKVYSATYSKAAGDTYLTHKIFDNATAIGAQYIALTDAVLTGSVLRLTFRNYFAGSATLWVKGAALLY